MPEKSFLAGAAEPVIRLYDGKRKFIDRDACTAYIAAMEKHNQKPYHLPKAAGNKITEHQFNGMTYYEISPDKPTNIRVLYLHGGSYFSPPHLFHWDMLTRIAEQSGANILVPIYPRAPIHTCSAAYSILCDFCAELFSPREDVTDVFMGDSAGGGLAMGLALSMANDGITLPKKLVLLSPWLDISMENAEMTEYEDKDPTLGIYGLKRMGKIWAGSISDHDPRVSPIYGNLSLLKDVEISVFVGTHEIFYPEVLRLERRLNEVGIPCQVVVGNKMPHVWVCYPMREGREAVEKISEIISK